MTGVLRRDAQIGARLARPALRRPWRLIVKMLDRKPRPQSRAIAAVETKEFIRRPIIQAQRDIVEQPPPDPVCAKHPALQAKEAQFVEWICPAETVVEF